MFRGKCGVRITEPKDLAKALRDAIKVVKAGKPALVDVVVQMR